MLALRRHSTVLLANSHSRKLKSSQIQVHSVAAVSRVAMASTSSSVVPPEGRAEATVHANGIGQIVLNRPAALNALSIGAASVKFVMTAHCLLTVHSGVELNYYYKLTILLFASFSSLFFSHPRRGCAQTW